MRIGIITPYDAVNYGAYLQAYASMRFLESQGNEVFMIKWRTDEERKKKIFKKPNTVKESIRALFSYIHTRKKYHVMTAALDKFNAIYPEEIKKYKIDAVIVGSDIVWNICDENYKKNMFYGKGLPCDVTCFAYAPSAGNAKYEDFNSYHEQKEGIKDIKIIGVRDENTAEIVKKISGVKPELVCDPTMLINVEEYNVNKARLLNDKFLLVYAYYVSDKYRIYLKRYARKKGFKLVSVCMYHRWCDINLVCHPLEFSSLINQAECVFTSTFHGSIFTLLNHKPCAILASSKKGCDLLKWTAMEEVRIKDDIEYKEFELLLNRQPDYIKFEQALDIRRMKSRNLYISAMQEISNGRDM